MPIALPPADTYWLRNASVPEALTTGEGIGPGSGDSLTRAALLVSQGRFARIVAEPAAITDGLPALDLAGRMLLPRFVDIHTHLDKGHIFARAPNPDGTFMGALTTVMADREANWSAGDVAKRMDFALRCAFHHGTGAIRTHLDTYRKQTPISWGVFNDMRQEWKGRIDLQAAAIFVTMVAVDDEAEFRQTVEHVTRYGGVLGGVTYRGEAPGPGLIAALDRTFEAAKANGLDLDFHVDESGAEDARTLELIADAAIRHKFTGKILAGHCCSLALMLDDERARVIEKLGEANVAIVSLPMCNMYLQDRISGRTPRWRGVAPLHELDAAGVATMVASDNTRDPFYAYGDLDCVEVFREATRILHFDHSQRPWLESLTTRAADHLGLAGAGRLQAGAAADGIIFAARTLNEWLSRPQHDRQVLIGGKASHAPLPDYAELDTLSA